MVMTITSEEAEFYISLEENQRHLVYITFTITPKDSLYSLEKWLLPGLGQRK